MSTGRRSKPANPGGLDFLEPELRAVVLGLHAGSLGRTVRCTPARRTVYVPGPPALFGKWREGGRAAAAREWHWLHVLPLVGLRAPRPVAWVGDSSRSLLVTEAVGGRPMDAWMAEAAADGWLDLLCDYAARHVAPAVRQLHAAGLVYRDLYWNHVFAVDPRRDEPPTFIDVERVFRPRWRWRRWVVKDLAGLWASAERAVPTRAGLRFLRRYGGAALDRGMASAVVRKARRIRSHAPRYG